MYAQTDVPKNDLREVLQRYKPLLSLKHSYTAEKYMRKHLELWCTVILTDIIKINMYRRHARNKVYR